MLSLARYTLKGPYQAAATVALLAVLAVFSPLLVKSSPALLMLAIFFSFALQLISCALVGLIILTQGSVSGFKAIVVSVIGISLAGWALMGVPEIGISTALVQWLPIILLAQTLRSTNSLALTLLTGVFMGCIVVAAQYLLLGEAQDQWLQMMMQRIGEVNEQNEVLAESYANLIQWLVMSMVPLFYLMFMSIVLVARSLQARLNESTGFGDEFRALELGKSAAMVGLLVIVAGSLVQHAWLNSLGYLVMTAFLFQGIAVLHSRLGPKKQGGLLLGLYYFLLLFLLRITLPLTALTGIADNWLGFRKKKPESPDH